MDAEYAKRIGNIKSRITKIETEIRKYHPGLDRAEKAIARIDKIFEADKAKLTEEYHRKKEQFKDKDAYISQKASELYNEILGLKKGVKASEQLGYLLDHGYEWSSIKSALINIKHTPDRVVNVNSPIENIAREMLDESYETAQADMEVEYLRKVNKLETEAEQKRQSTRIASQRKAKSEEHTNLWKRLAGDTSTWVDKKWGLAYQTNTLRRNLRYVVRDKNGNRDIAKADAIYDELQGSYNHNEAELNRRSAQIKKQFADMNINKYEDAYIQMLGEFRHNPDSTIEEADVKDYLAKHKGKIDEAKVDKAIKEARKVYDQLFTDVNSALRDQGMKEIPYRKGYFPHFTEQKQGLLAKLFNWKVRDDSIPTSIAGLTEDFNPDRSWQSFNKQRKTDVTDYSFTKGLDMYVQGALDWYYHIDDIQKNRSFENYLRYVHSEKGIQERIDSINNDSNLTAEEAQALIDHVYEEAGNPLNNFVTDLRTRTNTLAGKKSSMDRGMEAATNRKVYSVVSNVSNRFNANVVAGSVSSALTNFIPITQSWGQVSPVRSLQAMGDTLRSIVRDDGTIDKSDFLTNRLRQAEKLYKSGWDKASEKAGLLMDGIDFFTSQVVWRSKYRQNLDKGMSEKQAIKDADQFAENVMAGRSRGNMPTIFDSKNMIAKIFTAFQLENANQYGYMFEDMPQDMQNETKAKLAVGYATMYIGAYAYNALYSSLTGRNAAFDPIRIIEELLNDLGVGEDDEDEEPDIVGAAINLKDNILEELPFVGGLLGGGRIPLNSAIPYGGISEMIDGTAKDIDSGDWSSLTNEWMNPVYYLALPFGGGQLKKTAAGLEMYDLSEDHPIAGSYTKSGNLRYPVDDDPLSVAQAAIFGQYANENARKYFDEEQQTLNPEQTKILAEMDIPIEDYWEYRDKLDDFKATKNAFADAANADGATDEDVLRYTYINNVYSSINDLYEQQKELASGNAKNKQSELRKLQKQMDQMVSESTYGLDNMKISGAYGEVGGKRYNKDLDSGKWYEIKPKNADGSDNWYYKKEQEVTNGLGISYEQYWNNREEYNFAYDKPGKYAIAQAVGGYDSYMEYYDVLENWQSDTYISADKDAQGNSISGSRKKKVQEYIDSLDLDYGEKIILYRTVYSSKADKRTYNSAIIDYLNNRPDISYKEMESILVELGFSVDPEGYITW